MSAGLLDQLSEYGADHRARQAPVEMGEILACVEDLTDESPRREDEEDEEHGRSRYRIAIAAAAAVVLFGVAGLVLTARSDTSEPSDVPGTDMIQTVDPSLPSTTMTSIATPTTAVPDTTRPEDVRPAIPTIAATTFVGESTSTAGPTYDDRRTLGAWEEGFLVVTITGGVLMTAELSDEMFSRLPPEVREAYPEGLEGPLGEVTSRLQEDGLLDEVQAALEADPELNEAVRSGPTTPIELAAEYTIDGEFWTDIDLAVPADMYVEDVFIAGDRVVAVGTPGASLADPTDAPYRSMLVASTVDLEDWSIQTVSDAVETLAEVSIVVNERGWVAHIEPDLCQADDERGTTCESPGRDSYGYNVGEGPPLTWAASWGGPPTPVEGAVAAEGVEVFALQTGFLAVHDNIEFSADGLRWAPVRDAPTNVSIEGTAALDGGATAVVVWADTCDSEFYRVDQTGQGWERIELEIDGAARGLLPNQERRASNILTSSLQSSAFLVDNSGPIISTSEFEQDGLRLTRLWCQDRDTGQRWFASYELVDIGSGTVLAAEDTNGWTDQLGPFDHLIEDDEGDTVIDPATGDELLVAKRDQMTGIDTGMGGADTDRWLLATTSGTEWLVDDHTLIGSDPPLHAPQTAARNGDIILVATASGWLSYHLPNE